ncbi:MAG: DUF2752 domain-containing protein [Holophagaceae bacterium]|nr:DUF2752 domain-containing protein [Holophagaceae bacterium]
MVDLLQAKGKKLISHALPTRLIQLFAALTIGLSFIFRADALSKLKLCIFHATTGLSCPGCGMTRAFCAISHGQFADAWNFNPFAYFFYPLTLLCLIYPTFINTLSDKVILIIGATLALLLTIFGVIRVLAEVGLL